jgi:hypothetical protein
MLAPLGTSTRLGKKVLMLWVGNYCHDVPVVVNLRKMGEGLWGRFYGAFW